MDAQPLAGDDAKRWVEVLRDKVGAVLLNADLVVEMTDGPARQRAEAIRRCADQAATALIALDGTLERAA